MGNPNTKTSIPGGQRFSFRGFRWKAFLFVLLLMGLVLARVFWVGIPEVVKLKEHYPVVTYHTEDQIDRVKVRFLDQRPSFWVSIEDVSKFLVGAVVTSEDWAFYDHEGIDFKQLRKAVEESLREGELTRGASTITQQVAKNVFLSQERSLIRKFREWWVASELEDLFTKEELLEIYLNTVEWGPGVRGIEEAAWYYFRKSPTYLEPRESAFLAFLIPSPLRYHISYEKKELTDFAQYQIRRILTRMLKAGYLNRERYHIALNSELSFVRKGTPVGQNLDEPGAMGSFQALDLEYQE